MGQQISHTIKEQVYHYLKASILSGEYAMGESLKEVEIAEKLQVSRTPVREGISQLVSDGLLSSSANKRVCVRRFTQTDIYEIMDVRSMFEQKGIKTLVNGGVFNAERLMKIRQDMTTAYQKMDTASYSEVDFALHKEIVSYCDNQIINEFHTRLHNIIQMLRNIALKNESRFDKSYGEHMEIIEYLLAGEYAAWDADDLHIRRTSEEICSFLETHSVGQ